MTAAAVCGYKVRLFSAYLTPDLGISCSHGFAAFGYIKMQYAVVSWWYLICILSRIIISQICTEDLAKSLAAQ
jgi:hypothetical protein